VANVLGAGDADGLASRDVKLPLVQRAFDLGVEPGVCLVQPSAGKIFATHDTVHSRTGEPRRWLHRGEEIECPLHQGKFHIATGKAVGVPCTEDIRTYAVKIKDGAACCSGIRGRGKDCPDPCHRRLRAHARPRHGTSACQGVSLNVLNLPPEEHSFASLFSANGSVGNVHGQVRVFALAGGNGIKAIPCSVAGVRQSMIYVRDDGKSTARNS